MTELYELGDGRVLEATVTPDTPGHYRRSLLIRQIAGAEFTDEEWQDLAREWTVSLIDAGNTVHSVEVGRDDAETELPPS